MTSFDPPDQHRIPNRYKINFRPENHTSHISLNGDVVFSNTKQSFKPTLLSASLQVPSNLGSALSISRRRAPLIPSTVDISDITAAGQEEEKVQQQQQVKAFQTTESLTATVNTKNKSQEKCQTLEAYAQRVQQNDSGDMLLKEFIKYQLDAYQPNFLPNFSKMREEMTKAMAKPEVKKNPFWIHDLLRLLRLTLLDRQSDGNHSPGLIIQYDNYLISSFRYGYSEYRDFSTIKSPLQPQCSFRNLPMVHSRVFIDGWMFASQQCSC
jgi:hypothetical protein